MADVRIDHKDLERLYAGIFAAKGMSASDAGAVADVLAWANVRGVDGHGGVRIPGYLDYIDSGDPDPRAQPQVKTLGPTAFTVDAARSAGPVAMMKAAKLAVETARQYGVAIALVHDTTPTGAIGRYPQWVAEQGCVAVMMNGGPPFMAYYGTRTANLGTSPISIAVPGPGDQPLLRRHGNERRLQRPPAPGDHRRRDAARGLGARCRGQRHHRSEEGQGDPPTRRPQRLGPVADVRMHHRRSRSLAASHHVGRPGAQE